MDMKTVVVIGGGAAGMMACGRAMQRGHRVILVEKNDILGKKLRITGKGRCNITNVADRTEFFDHIPVNSRFMFSAFAAFDNHDTIEFFHSQGLKTKVERGGRVFPESDKAKDVTDALIRYASDAEVIKGEAKEILTTDGKVSGVLLKNGKIMSCDSVILATGGKSYPLTGSTGDGYTMAKKLGHTITPLKPSLVPMEVCETWVKELMGLSLKNVRLTVCDEQGNIVFSDFGEMLFAHFGLTGPIAISASSHMKAGKRYLIYIDLKPALSEEQLDKRIMRDFEKYSKKQFKNALDDLFPKKLIPVMIKKSIISAEKPVSQITKEERLQFARLIKSFPFTFKKLRPIEEAIITSGGVSVKEINPSTMESKLIDGLYFAGEIIDVDAYTGGFNLQIAFSTGYLAGDQC